MTTLNNVPGPQLLEGGQPNATWALAGWIWRQPGWGPLAILIGHLCLLWGMVALFYPQSGGQDLYWYLSSGKLLDATGLPTGAIRDPYSWTATAMVSPAAGAAHAVPQAVLHPWINHEWLFTRWLYQLHETAGIPGLVALKYALLLAWCGAFVWMAVRLARDWYLGLLTGLFTIPLLAPHTDLRPQLFTYLFVTLLLATWYRAPRRPWLALGCWALVLILWANLHGAVVFGVALLVALLCIHGFQRTLPWTLVLTGSLLMVVAPLVNPYGLEVYRYAFGWLANPELKFAIQEWRSITLGGFTTPAELCWLLWPLGILGVGAFTGALGKLRMEPQGWLMLAIWLMPLSAQRHLPLAHIALIPWWYQEIARALPWLALIQKESDEQSAVPAAPTIRGGQRWWLEWMTVIIAFSAIPLERLTWPWANLPRTPLEHLHPPYAFPRGAWAFIETYQLPRRLFNYYDWGGFCTWQIAEAPEQQHWIFIDGRLDTVYPFGVINAYGNIISAQVAPLTERPGWLEYGAEIETALLPTFLNGEEPQVLTRWKALPDWAVVYEDPLATVLVRRDLVEPGFIERAQGLHLPVPEDPQAHYARALQVMGFGDLRGAKRELEAALALDPHYAAAQRELELVRDALQE